MVADNNGKPTPDPTVLTTEQLERAISNVEKLMDARIEGIVSVFEERFNSIAVQLSLIASQRIEQKKDTKDAVDAALSAAKEAVKEQTASAEKSILKTETSTADQIKQMTQTNAVANDGLTVQIGDLKERVGKIENLKQGGADAFRGIYAAIAGVGGLIGLIVWAAGSGAFN